MGYLIAPWQAVHTSQHNTPTIVVQGLLAANLCPALSVGGNSPLLRGVSNTQHPEGLSCQTMKNSEPVSAELKATAGASSKVEQRSSRPLAHHAAGSVALAANDPPCRVAARERARSSATASTATHRR